MKKINYKLVPVKETGKKLQLTILYSMTDENFPNDGQVEFKDKLGFNYSLLKFLGADDVFKIIGEPMDDDTFAVVIREYDVRNIEFDLDELFKDASTKYVQEDFKSWNTDETH